jgi:N-acetylglucosaminyl-diphospho-decaprenol L-rhamnosyltransferase
MQRVSLGVCCIVLNHFGRSHTRDCIESLRGQAIDTLVLVDNSADRDEEAAIRTMARELEASAPGFRIEVVCNPENLGFAPAINAVVAADRLRRQPHGHYLLLNNDAVLPPDAVAVLLRALRARPNTAMVSPRIRTDPHCGCWLYYYPALGHISHRPSRWAFPYLRGACLLIDAAYVPSGGPFDAAFFFYGEDILLNWQIRAAGGVAGCVDEVVVDHIGNASSGRCTPFYEYHIAYGHLLLGRRLAGSALQRGFYWSARILYLSVRALLRSLRCRSFAPLLALGRALFAHGP